MRTIWKYPVPIADGVTLDMPNGARVLSVQIQNGTPCLWASVETNFSLQPRHFVWRGTGHELSNTESAGRFVGTIQMADGALVFHRFELG